MSSMIKVTAETRRIWALTPAELDAENIPREPQPGEDWCPKGVGKCDRQKGHPGGHGTKY